MTKRNHTLILFLLIFSTGFGQNIPKDFVELTANVASRGVYNRTYSLASETYYNYNKENDIYEQGEQVIFEYSDGKSIATSSQASGELVETFEFVNEQIYKYTNSTIKLEMDYTYDSYNKLVQSTLDQPTNKNKTVSTYDGEKIIKQEVIDATDGLIQYFEYLYNPDGTLFKRIDGYIPEVRELTYSYTGGNLSRIFTEVSTDGIISSTSEEVYDYYVDNKLKSKISYYDYGNSKEEYQYDRNGNLQIKTRYSYDNESWVLSSKEEYIYNYNVSIETIDLPGSIVYTTKAFVPFEIAPYHYKYIVPKYESGETKNFIKSILYFSWDVAAETWNPSRKTEYKLSPCIPDETTDKITACESYTWIDGTTYTESNSTAVHVLTNAEGCDSIVTLDLTIAEPFIHYDNVTSCGSYTWIDGITYAENNNTAEHRFVGGAPNGCDFIMKLNLEIVTDINVNVSFDGVAFKAEQTGVTYQWLDCNNNYEMIPGGTNQRFEPYKSGNYAVEITQSGCSAISDCVSNIPTDVGAKSEDNIYIYPNPTKGIVNVNLQGIRDAALKVYGIGGQVFFTQTDINESIFTFSLDAPRGIYFIEIKSDEDKYRLKFIKE